MKKSARQWGRSGLTAIEVLVILCILVILAALLLPRLSPPPRRGAQIVCVTNLKQIGLAWLQWVHDNEAIDLPFRVPLINGGTFGSTDPMRNTAWWQYAFLSNEISSPRVLVCPADRNVGLSRVMATNWGGAKKQGGLQAEGFRDRAVSYAIGLDARWPLIPDLAQILGSDRNIRFDGHDSGCSSTVGEAYFKRVAGKNAQNPPATGGWTNTIHGINVSNGSRGNVLTLDGAVQQTSTNELHALFDLSDDNGRIHFLVPK